MARALTAVGVGEDSAYELARLTESDLAKRGEVSVDLDRLRELAVEVLGEERGSRAVRINGEEARAVRKLIETSMLRALSPSHRADALPMLPAVEDLRDEFTRWIDTLILVGAGLRIVRRRGEAG